MRDINNEEWVIYYHDEISGDSGVYDHGLEKGICQMAYKAHEPEAEASVLLGRTCTSEMVLGRKQAMKSEYRIELWRQVLYEGTWEDGYWDYEYETIKCDDEKTAWETFKKAKEESDAEVIRLYKVYIDQYDCTVDEYLLDSTDDPTDY